MLAMKRAEMTVETKAKTTAGLMVPSMAGMKVALRARKLVALKDEMKAMKMAVPSVPSLAGMKVSWMEMMKADLLAPSLVEMMVL